MLDETDRRPGFDDFANEETQTRMVERKLSRSDSSPIVMLPVPASRDWSTRSLPVADGVAVPVAAPVPRAGMSASGKLLLLLFGMAGIGAGAASALRYCADHPATHRDPARAPALLSATIVTVAAPPTTGLPISATRPPVGAVARLVVKRGPTPVSPRERESGPLRNASNDELADARRTARLASDEVAASLR